jgi:muramoyltetrapeptide carboxypeptidase
MHLWNAGIFDECAGICIGEFVDCEPRSHRSQWSGPTPTVEDVVERFVRALGVPVVARLPLGHGEDLATVPLGARVWLDADACRLDVLEPAVVASTTSSPALYPSAPIATPVWGLRPCAAPLRGR